MKPIDPPEQSTPDRDLIELHSAVIREPPDPEEGRERGPWWLWTAIVLAIFIGGFYLGRYSGVFFENAVHVGYLRPSMVTADPTGAGGLSALPSEPLEKVGPRVYTANCVACHQADGKGVPNSFPPLTGSPWVVGDQETVVRILLKGLTGPVVVEGGTYNGAMPAWEASLSDDRIAAVATYIRTNLGNSATPVTIDTVKALREAHKDRTAPWTAEELEKLKGTP